VRTLAASLALALLAGPAAASEFRIPHEKHVLDNGLQVVLHEDHSDPLVAVYVYYHVGSGREEPGRSGFAHLFEHVMFQGSENVGDDQHFKLLQEAGGTVNGSTTSDRTNYFEVVPSNQLELALWLEADRMGWLLPAVTQENLDNQREVVKNERRQNYENRPYAQGREVIARMTYPPDHPYSWITIGSMEDLSAASLEDVHAFFKRWYGPNNATLAIGGDIDPVETLSLVKRYFGPIPRGPEVPKPAARPVTLAATKRDVVEDRVKLPELTWSWPTVEMGHEDEAALDLLASVLSSNDASVLDKALRIDEPLASEVRAWHWAQELAGTFSITLRPQPGVSLDELEGRMHRLLARTAEDGVAAERLRRLKTSREARILRRLETVRGRTSRLANDNTFFGEPDRVQADLDAYLAVSPDDVERVLRRWVLNRPAVVLSTVPRGKPELAATGLNAPEAEPWLDRSSPPRPGPVATFRPPALWHAELPNGVRAVGTRFDEIPMTSLSLSVPAGRAHESLDSLGLASLTAEMLEQGTRRLSASELADELDGLGASARARASLEEITISVTALDRHLPEVVGLLGEMLLEPRFAEADFERVRRDRLTDLETRSDQVRAVAGDAWSRLLHGPDDVRGYPSTGTSETLERLTVDDVRRFWAARGRPSGARLTWVGAADARGVKSLLRELAGRWKDPRGTPALTTPELPQPPLPQGTTVYLVDKPGAPQSEIRIGWPSVPETHPDHHALTVLNHPLGGSFSSRVNLNLREDKGYTYGARTGFYGGRTTGTFLASTGVRTNVTAASVAEIMGEIEGMLAGPTDEELSFTRDALVQAMNRRYESTRALNGLLEDVSRYGWPDDYLLERLATIRTIEREALRDLAGRHLHPRRAVILVVGDAAEVRESLEALGHGPVVELAVDGSPLQPAATSASYE
jgi:zinc protease